MNTVDTIVVGGGLSGLATAFFLQRAGHLVEVLEARTRAGGVIASRRRDSALYETGPNSTLDTTPLIGELLTALKIDSERVNASAQASRRFVIRNGRPIALPMTPVAFFATPLFSLGAKLALLREPFVAPAPPDAEESIAAFTRRRLGKEFLDYAIDPFVSGVYAGDPEAISVRAAFPRLHALEQRYGSLIRGQLKGARERKRSNEPAKNVAPSFSFRNGMQTLTDALAARVHRLTPGTSAERVVPQADGSWLVEARREGGPVACNARNLVLALPAHAAGALITAFADEAAAALTSIRYAPVAVVASSYRREAVTHPLDGFGFLVPKVEGRRILGSLFSSSMFDGRADGASVLLTTFVGGQRQPRLALETEDAIRAVVHEELTALAGVNAPPQWTEVMRWERAIPQYTLGHLDRLAKVDAAMARHRGLYFCANYRGGIAVGDCIKSAHATAEAIAAASR